MKIKNVSFSLLFQTEAASFFKKWHLPNSFPHICEYICLYECVYMFVSMYVCVYVCIVCICKCFLKGDMLQTFVLPGLGLT